MLNFGRTITIAAALVIAGGGAQALSDADKCEASKLQEAGKYLLCRLKAESKAVKTAATPDYTKCNTKLGDKFLKIETAASGQCPSTGDLAVAQGHMTQCSDDLAGAFNGGVLPDCPGDLATCSADLATCQAQAFGAILSTGQIGCWNSAGMLIACAGTGQDGEFQNGASRSFVDNGDGTITDTYTGLMWEKTGDDGSIHHQNNTYTWADAFTTKIAGLNSGNFAGYTDWRVPNRNELLSIYNSQTFTLFPAFVTPCSAGCSEQTCSCGRTDAAYWSSTTFEPTPTDALGVRFFSSLTPATNTSKGSARYVRAVRGGS